MSDVIYSNLEENPNCRCTCHESEAKHMFKKGCDLCKGNHGFIPEGMIM